MKILKSIFLLIGLNIAVMAIFSLILFSLSLFGIQIDTKNSYLGLLAYCFIFGMTGSFFSLFISKFITKKVMGIVTPKENENIVQQVKIIAEQIGLPMPEVGIFQSREANAFAIGWSKKSAMVAFSSELLLKFNQQELRGVIAHELAHIKNGDMLTITLLQGVVNTFVLFFSRIISTIANNVNENLTWFSILFDLVLQIIFGILATPIIMAYSRWREFATDKAGAKIVGKETMLATLKRLKFLKEQEERENINEPVHETVHIMAFSAKDVKKGIFKLYSSHPDIEKRIKAIEEMKEE